MAESDFIELIHRDIDGELSPQERATLEAYLERNAEARTLYEHLQKMAGMLERVEAAEPSPLLKQRIMAELSRKRVQQRREPHILAGFLAALRRVMTPQYGLAFAGGVAVTLLMVALFGNRLRELPPFEPAEVSGTLLQQTEPLKMTVAETLSFWAAGAIGEITVLVSQTSLQLDLTAESPQETGYRFLFDPAVLRPLTMSELQGDEALSWERGTAHVQWIHHGHSRLRMLFQIQSAENVKITFQVFRGDEILLEKPLTISGD